LHYVASGEAICAPNGKTMFDIEQEVEEGKYTPPFGPSLVYYLREQLQAETPYDDGRSGVGGAQVNGIDPSPYRLPERVWERTQLMPVCQNDNVEAGEESANP
jgi:hypothetical protein